MHYLGSRSHVQEWVDDAFRADENSILIDLFTMNWEDMDMRIGEHDWSSIQRAYVLSPAIEDIQPLGSYFDWLLGARSLLPTRARWIYAGLFPEDWLPFLKNAELFGYFLVLKSSTGFSASNRSEVSKAVDNLLLSDGTSADVRFKVRPSELRKVLQSHYEYLELKRPDYVEALNQTGDPKTVSRFVDYLTVVAGIDDQSVTAQEREVRVARWLRDFANVETERGFDAIHD